MRFLLFFLLVMPAFCSAQVITTLAGGGSGGTGDGGPATNATFGGAMRGFAVDRSGNIIIADWWGNRLRRVDAITGIITTIAGTGTGGYNGDSIPATNAMVWGPAFVATDTAGNIYFSESQNQRVRVIRSSGYIYTYAGNGTGAGFSGVSGVFSGDDGPATDAELDGPQGLALDSHGNLYVSDANNHRVRMIDAATGQISTVVGNGSAVGTASGVPATATGLAYVYDIFTDAVDRIYVADIGSGSKRVRLIDPTSHIIYNMAGTGTSLYNGDGITADSANISPFSMLSANGVLYISDYGNNRIRAVEGEFQIISTFAGNGFAGFSGDNGPASAACIFEPSHLAMDTCGSLYFADASNQRIRKISFDTSCHFGLTRIAPPITVYTPKIGPNPASSQVYIEGMPNLSHIALYNSCGILITEKNSTDSNDALSVADLKSGIYFLKIRDEHTGISTIRSFVKID